jgi:hypothetical protein
MDRVRSPRGSSSLIYWRCRQGAEPMGLRVCLLITANGLWHRRTVSYPMRFGWPEVNQIYLTVASLCVVDNRLGQPSPALRLCRPFLLACPRPTDWMNTSVSALPCRCTIPDRQCMTEPPKIIPYYCLSWSTWPLSNNKEVFCRLCRVMPGKSPTTGSLICAKPTRRQN